MSASRPFTAEFGPEFAAAPPAAAWITTADVAPYVGLDAVEAAADVYLGQCVAAANAWAARVRTQAGYDDDPTVAPDAAVKLGTVLAAGRAYRARGAVDGFAAFDALAGSTTATGGTLADVRRMLGVPRPGFG